MAVFRSFYEKKTTQVYLNPMVDFDKNRTLDVEIKMEGKYLFSHYKICTMRKKAVNKGLLKL